MDEKISKIKEEVDQFIDDSALEYGDHVTSDGFKWLKN